LLPPAKNLTLQKYLEHFSATNFSQVADTTERLGKNDDALAPFEAAADRRFFGDALDLAAHGHLHTAAPGLAHIDSKSEPQMPLPRTLIRYCPGMGVAFGSSGSSSFFRPT